MRIEDIANRLLLMHPDMATQIDYTLDPLGMITQEARIIETKSGPTSVKKKVTITYTRDANGYITQKLVKITTIE